MASKRSVWYYYSIEGVTYDLDRLRKFFCTCLLLWGMRHKAQMKHLSNLSCLHTYTAHMQQDIHSLTCEIGDII